jgi:hypothetical protein
MRSQAGIKRKRTRLGHGRLRRTGSPGLRSREIDWWFARELICLDQTNCERLHHDRRKLIGYFLVVEIWLNFDPNLIGRREE